MSRDTNNLLFSILRSALLGEPLNDETKSLVGEESLAGIWKLAGRHDLAHLVALGVLNNGLVPAEQCSAVQRFVFGAAYRYEQQNRELVRVCAALENAKIPFIPLKGSVLRAYYPEAWMRTSCDIDILVKEQDLQSAKPVMEELGFEFQGKGRHDLHFKNQNILVELHYTLIEENTFGAPERILEKVWEHTQSAPGKKYEKQLTDDYFYFYHIAHMAKHFIYGGCGIRPFIDLWLLDHIPEVDLQRRNTLLQSGKLLQFARTAQRLSRVWLEGESLDPVTEKMQDFVISGGVYGTSRNRIAVQQQKSGSKIKYAFSRIVLPYELMKFRYPILQAHPWLTPAMQVYRWIWVLACGRTRRAVGELTYGGKISKEQAAEMGAFLEDIGL